MKVIIGMVPNHTSRDHVWVTNNPSYYVSDGEGTIVYDLDWTDTAKLNYLDPGLRREMTETYDHWLSILGTNEDGQPDGVDGFRVDMAHFINDLSFWNEALPELRQRHAGRELLFLAECYGTENSLDLFTRGFNAAYDDLLYKVWELFYGRDADGASILLPDPELPSNTDFADLYQQYLSGGIAAVIRHVFSEYEARLGAMNEPHYFARYTDNHDEGRGVYRFGPEATWAMFQLIAFSRSGLPFLLTGQEFGAANRPSIHERIGPCDKGYRTRTEDGIVKREGVEFEGNLFARGREARQALYENYKSVLAFRRKHRALIDGPIDFIDCEEDAPPTTHTVVAFSRGKGKRALRCAVNMGSEDRVLGADAFREGEALYGHCPEGLLPAFSAVVMR
jgi:glycosidase